MALSEKVDSPKHLLVISDVQPVLREEERAAWQRLIRVIGHEVNNSLTPIKSTAESLRSLLTGLLAQGRSRDDTLDARNRRTHCRTGSLSGDSTAVWPGSPPSNPSVSHWRLSLQE